ncbi:Phytoene/squalene synthetase [Hoeflea phototrophica DFL-43]|uniref:Phytoene/squalene synthetase n=1 Tax=Hoeflea phototrophica (strain DSM 17068 / NCIMB 14078 / DFL-43) TaxID=411684 RepID=A9D5L7_HOEPD|nr:phytoene/squalene synthase family protein [Hoeflea phototrophica]EDQ33321.1 Phytoene/squalene synthetase [Hoeflea phototrophica DFL-43]
MAGAGLSQSQSTELRRSRFEALRAVDIDRYLALLLVPEAAQDDIATLLLFNAEIAAIRDRIREPLPGEIRLQWWREVLDGERLGEAEAHPLASQLLELIARRRLPLSPLAGMCEARVFDLYDDPMPDRSSYEGYAGETASALLQLSAFLLDADASAKTATASGHAGVAQAVAGHLMLLPISQARGQVFIPGDLLAATGLDRDSLLAGENRKAIDAAVRAFAGFGRDHLSKAHDALRDVASEMRPAYLPMALVEPVLKRAETLGSGCMETSPRPSQWRRQWRLWRAARSGRI